MAPGFAQRRGIAVAEGRQAASTWQDASA